MAPNKSRLEIKQREGEKAWYLWKDGWLVQRDDENDLKDPCSK